MMTLVFDCDYLCYRVYHTMLRTLQYEGVRTGITYGFFSTVIHLKNKFAADRLVFAFDSRHSKRSRVYPQYKAQRRPKKEKEPEEVLIETAFYQQRSLLRTRYLPDAGFRNILHQPGYESDDHMAQWVHNNQEGQHIIVTSDEDLYQVLSPKVGMYNPHKHQVFTDVWFCTEYGIQPYRWAQVKALAGCTSDNVQGVQGVGNLTAIKYLTNKLSPRTKAYKHCRAAANIMARNLPLVQLPYPGTRVYLWQDEQVTAKRWRTLCKKLGLESLAKEGWFTREARQQLT